MKRAVVANGGREVRSKVCSVPHRAQWTKAVYRHLHRPQAQVASSFQRTSLPRTLNGRQSEVFRASVLIRAYQALTAHVQYLSVSLLLIGNVRGRWRAPRPSMAHLASSIQCLGQHHTGALIPPVRSTPLDELELSRILGVAKRRAPLSRLTLLSMTSIIPSLSPTNLVSSKYAGFHIQNIKICISITICPKDITHLVVPALPRSPCGVCVCDAPVPLLLNAICCADRHSTSYTTVTLANFRWDTNDCSIAQIPQVRPTVQRIYDYCLVSIDIFGCN